jgi:hypothetical protein
MAQVGVLQYGREGDVAQVGENDVCTTMTASFSPRF